MCNQECNKCSQLALKLEDTNYVIQSNPLCSQLHYKQALADIVSTQAGGSPDKEVQESFNFHIEKEVK